MTFSPDGGRIVGAISSDSTRVWDTHTGRQIQMCWGHSVPVNHLTFSPDGWLLAGVTSDGSVGVWDLRRNPEARLPPAGPVSQLRIRVPPDGSRVVLTADELRPERADDTGGEAFPGPLRGFSRDGSLAIGFLSVTPYLWDTESGRPLRPLEVDAAETEFPGTPLPVSLRVAAFSPDGSRVASAPSLTEWDTRTGKDLLTTIYDGGGGVAFTPDGSQIVTGSDERTVRFLDADTGKERLRLAGAKLFVTSVAFSPDRGRVVIGADDGTAVVWDLTDHRLLFSLDGHSSAVKDVAFTPDGRRILTASAEGTVRIWDADHGYEILSLTGYSPGSPDGGYTTRSNRVTRGLLDRSTREWHAGGCLEHRLLRLDGDFRASTLVFSADGRYLIADHPEDDSTLVWDARTGRRLHQPTELRPGGTTSPDGRFRIGVRPAKSADVILTDIEQEKRRLAWDREKLVRWAEPDPDWHRRMAEEAEAAGRTFAAEFHRDRLARIEPGER